MYKQKPAIVTAFESDRIKVSTIKGEELRVRSKDITLVHPGPIMRFPDIVEFSEPLEAFDLLSEEHPEGFGPMQWREFAELCWLRDDPEHIVHAWRFLESNSFVELLDDGFRIRSEVERLAIIERERKRMLLAEQKKQFIEVFKAVRSTHKPLLADSLTQFQPFIDELGRFARGVSNECSIARELSIRMEPHAVHEALIDSGAWDEIVNPWPERNGCILSLPTISFSPEDRRELSIKRIDLRHLPSFAIDNAFSNDPDDAISFDGETIWIHVADPGAVIDPHSEIDKEAMIRGSTLYLPEKTIPMLPFESINSLGLGLQEESRALSFGISLDRDGKIAHVSIMPSIVRVIRLTYQKADSMLDSNSVLKQLQGIYEQRIAFRRAHGAIEIDFPEVAIAANKGTPSFISMPQTVSAHIVQEMMILAGEAAARWAYDKKLPFPFSTQDYPHSSLDTGSGEGPSKSLAENFSRRRSMRASAISTTCSAHAGLGLSFYSQVTSPLRRYQDLLAHYQIHALLAHEQAVQEHIEPRKIPSWIKAEALDERLYISSSPASKNKQAERDSRIHWTMVHLKRHRDWRGKGIVLDASEYGQIYIPEFGYESSALLPRNSVPDAEIPLTLRSVSIPMLSARFDVA